MRFAVLLLIALPAFGKSLHWRTIDVQARLDAQGRLHVVERQTIVFDGDWNGGERDFNLRNRQKLVLHRLLRVEEGREIPLVAGHVEAVDHYDFTSRSVLRWRSRMPGDPPFESRELTYVLDYTYENVLELDGSTPVFWHDFGLPERQGAIDVFTLQLDFDPVWQTAPVSETRSAVQPRQGVVIRRDFARAPAALVESMRVVPPWAPGLLLGGFAAAIAVLIAMFFRAEAPLGRFARVAPALDEEVLALRAEVAGAIWDADVGAPEVAATLARLEQEGKITTRVEKKVLHMKLNVSPCDMSGYERHLVARIFGGDDTMDTKRLKERYKSSGFDPAKEITPGIETAIGDVVPGWNAKTRRFRRMSHVITLAGAALLLAGAGFGDDESLPEALLTLTFGGFFGLLACGVAPPKSRAITAFGRAFLTPALLLVFPVLIFCLCVRALPMGRVSLAVTIGVGLWVLMMLRLALDLLKIRESREVIALRKRVLAVRKFFIAELRKPQPALRDEWFPYLLAFGLGRNADRWFRAFGSAASHVSSSSSSSSSGWTGSSSSSSSSWTGGGGSFGGAGATGSWAVAAAGVAAGVASPGSSSGGGGGSSSGGGGGGGW